MNVLRSDGALLRRVGCLLRWQHRMASLLLRLLRLMVIVDNMNAVGWMMIARRIRRMNKLNTLANDYGSALGAGI